ncbi:MAG: 50S ribosomal protein L25/general stress protein Ctc [Holosporales bacterium]
MSEVNVLSVQRRERVGGGASRELRRSGLIPGIIYGDKKDNVSIALDPRWIERGLHQTSFYSTAIEIEVEGKRERALVREVQFHPVSDRPIHVDFVRLGKGAKTHVAVPVVFLNEAKCPGIKHGGILNVVLHALDVTCPADAIPEKIEIDLSGLEVGATIHTADLKLPKGVVPTHPERDVTIATLLAPKGSADAAAGATGEAAS